MAARTHTWIVTLERWDARERRPVKQTVMFSGTSLANLFGTKAFADDVEKQDSTHSRLGDPSIVFAVETTAPTGSPRLPVYRQENADGQTGAPAQKRKRTSKRSSSSSSDPSSPAA